ncbi:MAG: YlxR family protein, partial [Deltaproteobacteria bacterium]|nr:YlxR family protein [Deltaproteobacteria bacterium]
CIACGSKRPKNDLVRLVLSDGGEIREAPKKETTGRGAYVCGRPDCREKLKAHRKLNRVFRTEGPLRLARELHDGTRNSPGVSVPQAESAAERG